MRALSTIAALLALLVTAQPAAADLAYPTDTPAASVRVQDSLRIAEQLLGTPACDLHIYWARLGPLAGVADMTDCVIWLATPVRRDYTERIDACTIQAHELEHILGYYNATGYIRPDGRVDHQHSPDRAALMWPFAQQNVLYACYRRYLPRHQGATWRALHPDVPWSTLD